MDFTKGFFNQFLRKFFRQIDYLKFFHEGIGCESRAVPLLYVPAFFASGGTKCILQSLESFREGAVSVYENKPEYLPLLTQSTLARYEFL